MSDNGPYDWTQEFETDEVKYLFKRQRNLSGYKFLLTRGTLTVQAFTLTAPDELGRCFVTHGLPTTKQSVQDVKAVAAILAKVVRFAKQLQRHWRARAAKRRTEQNLQKSPSSGDCSEGAYIDCFG